MKYSILHVLLTGIAGQIITGKREIQQSYLMSLLCRLNDGRNYMIRYNEDSILTVLEDAAEVLQILIKDIKPPLYKEGQDFLKAMRQEVGRKYLGCIVHLKNCVVLLIELICWYSFLFENIIFNHFRLFMFAVELTILMMQKRFLIASFHRALIKGQKTKRWDYGTTAQWGKLDVWSSQNES